MKIAVLVITVLLLSGCGGSKIDGTYCNKSSDLVVACYTFRSNGTVLYSAAGAPVIDIVGIRPGLTYEEAANVVLCDNPMLVVEAQTASWSESNTYGQKNRQDFSPRCARGRIKKTPKQ